MRVIAPIFPLPNVVFFPDTFLPLHVFEPRYRAMLADAMQRDRLIVVVLAREEKPPGEWPAIHRIGTLGRVAVAERLQDDRWHVALEGVARVKIDRLRERSGGYFAGRIEALGEALPDLQDPEVAERKAELLLVARRYQEQVLADPHGGDYLKDVLPYATLVNRVAAMLRAGVREKQALLSLDDLGERARAVEGAMSEQIDAQAAVERFGRRRPDAPTAN